jgi:hypothetical protein
LADGAVPLEVGGSGSPYVTRACRAYPIPLYTGAVAASLPVHLESLLTALRLNQKSSLIENLVSD